MVKWKQTSIGEFIDFNPSEQISKGTLSKKVPMAKLTEWRRDISGYELAEYGGGPKFRNGDTLVAKITPCLENGKTAKVDILEDGEVGFGSTEFIVLRANENSISDFIYYLARSPIFRERAISCMEGTSGRKRVNEGALKRQELLVPDKQAQQDIANILSALDDKISLNNRINTELEALAKTIYDYWFVQFDFPDAQGRPYKASGGKMVYNEVLKREVPEGWGADTIECIADIIGGSTPSREVEEYFTQDGGFPWITPKDLSLNTGNTFIAKGELNVTDLGKKAASLKVMPAGTVLMSSRAPIGYMAIASTATTTNQGFKSFVPKAGFPTEFVFYVVKNLLSTIIANASGSTFKEVSSSVVKALQIAIPDKSVIERYVDAVKSIFKKQELLEQENLELAGVRDWLLPLLMNGQVTAKVAYNHISDSLSLAADAEISYSHQ